MNYKVSNGTITATLDDGLLTFHSKIQFPGSSEVKDCDILKGSCYTDSRSVDITNLNQFEIEKFLNKELDKLTDLMKSVKPENTTTSTEKKLESKFIRDPMVAMDCITKTGIDRTSVLASDLLGHIVVEFDNAKDSALDLIRIADKHHISPYHIIIFVTQAIKEYKNILHTDIPEMDTDALAYATMYHCTDTAMISMGIDDPLFRNDINNFITFINSFPNDQLEKTADELIAKYKLSEEGFLLLICNIRKEITDFLFHYNKSGNKSPLDMLGRLISKELSERNDIYDVKVQLYGKTGVMHSGYSTKISSDIDINNNKTLAAILATIKSDLLPDNWIEDRLFTAVIMVKTKGGSVLANKLMDADDILSNISSEPTSSIIKNHKYNPNTIVVKFIGKPFNDGQISTVVPNSLDIPYPQLDVYIDGFGYVPTVVKKVNFNSPVPIVSVVLNGLFHSKEKINAIKNMISNQYK